jgi:hypothetical protein
VDRQCQGYKGSTKHINHSSGWKIARVFVSSTFTDFHDEREIHRGIGLVVFGTDCFSVSYKQNMKDICYKLANFDHLN